MIEELSGPPEAQTFYAAFFVFLLTMIPGNWTTLAQRGFERQFTIGDLTQGDIGMTHPGNEFDQWTVSNGELSNTARNHVHENLLILDYFVGGFNKFGLHN